MESGREPLCWMLILLSLALASSTEVVNGPLAGLGHFDVSVPLPEDYRIMWNFGEIGNVTVVMFGSNVSDPIYNFQYRGRSDLLHNGTLILRNLTYADGGHYCLYVYDDEHFTTTIVPYQLNVYDILQPPSLTIISGPAVDGTKLTIECETGSQNVTSYTFYRDEKTICSEPHVTCRGRYLDFTPITENDNGIYTCSIQNPVSSSSSNFLNVTVSVPVSAVTLTSNISDRLLWPGRDSVSLQCSSTGTDVRYSWSLDGAPVPPDPRYQLSTSGSTLSIKPISSNDDGHFICSARNRINSENSSGLHLTLAVGVSAVTLTSNTSAALWAGQDSVSLYCSARGSAVTFSWSLKGEPLSPHPSYSITQSDSPPSSTLTISPVSRGDTGPFTCTATNLLNTETSNELSLNMNWRPEGQISCTERGHDGVLQLDCSWPGGRPAPNVTMIFDDITEKGKTKVTRNVSLEQTSLGSNLTCIGEYFGETLSCALILGASDSSEERKYPIISANRRSAAHL
ncbi:cell adhesion molecule CEACAM1-like [Engystomops pustulosus]